MNYLQSSTSKWWQDFPDWVKTHRIDRIDVDRDSGNLWATDCTSVTLHRGGYGPNSLHAVQIIPNEYLYDDTAIATILEQMVLKLDLLEEQQMMDEVDHAASSATMQP